MERSGIVLTGHARERIAARCLLSDTELMDAINCGRSVFLVHGPRNRPIELIFDNRAMAFVVLVLGQSRDAIVTVLTLDQARNSQEMAPRLTRANFIAAGAHAGIDPVESICFAGISMEETSEEDFLCASNAGLTVRFHKEPWGDTTHLWLDRGRRQWWVGKRSYVDGAVLWLKTLEEYERENPDHPVGRSALIQGARLVDSGYLDAMVMAGRNDDRYFHARVVVRGVARDGRIRDVVTETQLTINIDLFDAAKMELGYIERIMVEDAVRDLKASGEMLAIESITLRAGKDYIGVLNPGRLVDTPDQVESAVFMAKWLDTECVVED